MMMLLLLKSRIKNFYEGHYRVVRGCLKVLLSFLALFLVTRELNYNEIYGSYPLLLALALICGLTPDPVSVLVTGFVICAEVFQVSPLLGGSVLAVLLIFFLLFGRLGGLAQAFIVFSVPVLAAVHISYIVPIVVALFCSPVMIPAVLMGVLLQYMMQGVGAYAVMAGTTEQEDITSSFHYMTDQLLGNREMLIVMGAFFLAFICVYLVRRGQFRHSFQIAILVGGIVLMAVELSGNIMMELQMSMAMLTWQVVLSVLLCYIVQFFHLTLDYQGTKRLQFEDDEYYYYVTAVPKFKVAVVDRTVTRILSDKKEDKA